MGLAMVFVAAVAIVGIPIALVCLVLAANYPLLWLPIIGIAGLIIFLRARSIRAHDEAIIQQIRAMEQEHREQMAALEAQWKIDEEESREHDRRLLESIYKNHRKK